MANINDQAVGHVYVDQLSKYESLTNAADTSIFYVKNSGIFVGSEPIANYINLVDLLTKEDASIIYQKKLTFDEVPTVNSSNPVKSGGVFEALSEKQDILTAGEGINIANNIVQTTGIPFGICDPTCTSTAFTATVPGIYKLEDGVCCLVKNGVVTSSSGFTLDINGLGPKPSYSNMATGNDVEPKDPTRDTTIFNINYAMLFIYSSTIVEGGGWICYRGYDANTNTIGYQIRTNSYSLPASSKFYKSRLLFTSADGTHFVPANTSSSTSATAAKTVNQTPIDPFGKIVYYGSSTTVEANSRPSTSNLWQQYTLTLGYSFNRTGAALTLTSWKPVYVKCAPQANGSAIIDKDIPVVQDLPSSADGKIYIYLGVAYSATAIELTLDHPVYYHDGTGIRIWTGTSLGDYYSKTEINEMINLVTDELTWQGI